MRGIIQNDLSTPSDSKFFERQSEGDVSLDDSCMSRAVVLRQERWRSTWSHEESRVDRSKVYAWNVVAITGPFVELGDASPGLSATSERTVGAKSSGYCRLGTAWVGLRVRKYCNGRLMHKTFASGWLVSEHHSAYCGSIWFGGEDQFGANKSE